ncbi:MAG: fibrobacter succinogenes major paralogous domain-containing protein [Prevotellaceae bacterium]|jgi:uncharacterized protein (TIGR02145 family)|nr:fibrobacter succinogenes major paralogous domain-containing protein [Prevotellaceae bacterium]
MSLRKIFVFLFLLGLTVVLFASCKDDIDRNDTGNEVMPPPPAVPPVYTLVVGESYVFGATVATVTVDFGVEADINARNWRSSNPAVLSLTDEKIYKDTINIVTGEKRDTLSKDTTRIVERTVDDTRYIVVTSSIMQGADSSIVSRDVKTVEVPEPVRIDTIFITALLDSITGKDTTSVTIRLTASAGIKTESQGSAELFVDFYQRDSLIGHAIPCRINVVKYAGNAVDDAGVIINGLKWATRNVDAPGSFVENPEDSGLFYQWNSRAEWTTNLPPEAIAPYNNKKDTTGNWNMANDPCPKGWRMPTQDELQSLFNVGKTWQPRNGVNGCWFFENDNLLFFPAAGYRYERDGMVYLNGKHAAYWSSSRIDATTAYALSITTRNDEGGIQNNRNDVSAGYGLSCRCVKAE